MNTLAIILLAVGIVVGIAIGSYFIPQLSQPAGNCTSSITPTCPKCNVTDVSSIQRAFQQCFNNFNPTNRAATCINFIRFKDCINTAMGRFK
jgi:hypothetical protein